MTRFRLNLTQSTIFTIFVDGLTRNINSFLCVQLISLISINVFICPLFVPGRHTTFWHSTRVDLSGGRYNNRLVCVLLSKATDDNPIKLVQTLEISSFDATYDEIKN